MVDSQATKPQPVLVLILRRDEGDLIQIEKSKLKEKFGDRPIHFQRTDPADYMEHADNCRRLKPDAVLLPLDLPIPHQAMREGIQHIALVRGIYKKLRSFEPVYEDFNPLV